MMTHKLISADSHIVEPPDLYTTRIEPRFRDRAPRLERMETPTGRKFDAWTIDGQQAGSSPWARGLIAAGARVDYRGLVVRGTLAQVLPESPVGDDQGPSDRAW